MTVLALLFVILFAASVRSLFAFDALTFRLSKAISVPGGEQPDLTRRELYHLFTASGGAVVVRETVFDPPSMFTDDVEQPALSHTSKAMPFSAREYADMPTAWWYLDAQVGWTWLGYGAEADVHEVRLDEVTSTTSGPVHAVAFPLPLLALVSGTLPAFWLRGHLRQRRLARRGFAVEPAVTVEAASSTSD